ncbi:NAD-dependent epimerase/dehydratase family protein [Pseudooctadecabacter jejudonensis]|uniref:NAD dependent epimerase/dehydratase family protein n=1 Tax=Pseudooctadecabacter jejudonensis TaxID=1391910 RepID=A0A1Y5TB91_9RHOB|nr:NAD(P)-dependent oxidoreductase [Pseudooctadecabacter jejudonensis]SLN56465.1 NAD dependent epimerase/dehydratase family protein [Pseudooctadecabacter jejudonensis]
MSKLYRKIVLTGACGALGMQIRETLAARADTLLSMDIADAPDTLLPNETFVQADCASLDAVLPLMEGADIAVHFASIPDERPFEDLLGPNYLSSYNVWEAGHRHGVKRVIYASSVHAVGMVENAAGADLDVDHAPDTFYGLAKCFTEDLGKLYWTKRGMESVHLRIFSCTEEPQNPRALRTWLSYDDLRHLVDCAVKATTTGFTCIWGLSNNDRAPVNNAKAAFLGYHPKDNAENWVDALMANAPASDPSDPAQLCLGGPFATVPLGESGVAGIKAMGAAADSAPTQNPAQAEPNKLPSFLTKKGMGQEHR